MGRESQVVTVALPVVVGAVFVWSYIGCHDRFTWVLETAPAIIGIAILAATWRRFRFTTLVYVLIALHAMVLMVGGHYTYARVPLFDSLRDWMHFSRNNYDRLGHFMQGFVPAMIAREVLLRTTPLRRGKMLTMLVLSVCLAISASYELVEFGVAKWQGTAADDFLGTRGDPWDTQWDMFCCLVGAICSVLFLSRMQDRQLSGMRVSESEQTPPIPARLR